MLSNDERAAVDAHVKKVLAYERAIEEDQTPLAKLLTLVGRHLTGRRVGVRLRKSVYADSDVVGTYYCTPRGGGIIDLAPSRPLPEIYMTFLHECGHLKHHYFDVGEDYPFALMDPQSYKVTPPAKRTDLSAEARSEILREEAEADDQAAKWDAYASALGRLEGVGWNASAADGPIEFFKLHVLANKNL